MQDTFLSLDKKTPAFEQHDETVGSELLTAFIQLSDQVNLIQVQPEGTILSLIGEMGGLGDGLFLIGILLTNVFASQLF